MSFGFSVGDFLAVIELVSKIRKDFVGAPDQFEQISTEVRNLGHILQDVDIFLADEDLSATQGRTLGEIVVSCHHVLRDIETLTNKYSSLEEKTGVMRRRARRIWERFKWDPDEIRDLRDRIVSNIAMLGSFTAGYTRDAVLTLTKRQTQQEHKEVLDWLTPVDFAAQQADFIGRRHPDTGQWLLETPKYLEWREKKGNLLFCHGIPGAGKTILSSVVVANLQKAFHGSHDVAVCYFYCDFRRQDEQNLDTVFLSLLKQLAQAMRYTPDSLLELFNHHQKDRSRPSFEATMKAFHSAAAQCSRVFVVVDALDECRTSQGCQRQVISELIRLQKATGANVLVTSRPLPHIVEYFSGFPFLEIRAVTEDVKKYVDGNMKNLPGFVLRNPELQNEIMAGITDAVDGMFLLAQFHLDSLMGRRSPRQLRETLVKLAKGGNAYTEVYNNTMERISGQVKDQAALAFQALMWIIYSQRPMSTTELQHALAIEVGDTEFFEDNLADLQDTISVCCGLLTIDEKSNVVRLIHHTAQEYFESNGQRWFPAPQAELTNACVTYLLFDEFSSGRCPDEKDVDQRLCRFPFFEYSSRYWGLHAQSTEDHALIREFLNSPNHLAASSQVLLTKEWNEFLNEQMPNQISALHLVSFFGLTILVNSLLVDHDANMTDSLGHTPLLYAARCGHPATVRILLHNKAQVDLAGGIGDTPLLWAASNGHDEVVRLLLESNAEVDRMNNLGHTPLFVAVLCGHEGIVRTLLEKNASVHLSSKRGRTPLSMAVYNGQVTILRILLDKDTQVDFAEENGRTPLSFAVEYGHDETVLLLLDKGAQVDWKDKDGRTPLYFAVEYNHDNIIRILLDKGAQVGLAEKNGRTPLSLAIECGYDTIVRMLLEKVPRVDFTDDLGRTSLHLAAVYGYETFVQMLLEKGLQTDQRDVTGRTPLSLAAEYGNNIALGMLLDKEAQVDLADNEGRTPLSWAAQTENNATVALLADRQADINLADTTGRSPLSFASRFGRIKVVKVLLSKGATVADQDTICNRTPLLWACDGGHVEIVKALLTAGSDPQVQDILGRSALMYLIYEGDTEAIDFLLQYSLDVNARDHWGSTALCVAARCGCLEVVKQVAALPGVDMNIADRFGRSPLWWAQKKQYTSIEQYLLDHNCESSSSASQSLLSHQPAVGSYRIGFVCDICDGQITGLRYHCDLCAGGNLDLCETCRSLGAYCLVESHELSEH